MRWWCRKDGKRETKEYSNNSVMQCGLGGFQDHCHQYFKRQSDKAPCRFPVAVLPNSSLAIQYCTVINHQLLLSVYIVLLCLPGECNDGFWTYADEVTELRRKEIIMITPCIQQWPVNHQRPGKTIKSSLFRFLNSP